MRENIERQALWANSRFSTAQLLTWAEEVELLALLDEPAAFLSQGQKKQIALARLRLFGQRALWLLDEPFNSLDQLAV
ncbi:ATP-binding cassette domain-containing protein, partial [Micrococcus luteus]|nr:ATP-binding cassette domain-containing protein [Micrococcus luteus]